MFVATDDEDVNARAYRDASGAHLMVNVADQPELCTFFLPSVLRRGKLSIAVSTEGASPLTARRLRSELEERIPAGFEAYLNLLAAWRPRAIAALPDEPARSASGSRPPTAASSASCKPPTKRPPSAS